MIPIQSWVVNLVKVFITVLLAFVIYQTICRYRNELVWPAIKIENIFYVVAALLLMPINWLLESMRWQNVMNVIGLNVKLKKSIQSTLAGLTLSLMTPFRIGDYIGRMLLLGSPEKKPSLYATFVCSLYQNIINFFFGFIAIFFLIKMKGLFFDQVQMFVLLNFLAFIIFSWIVYRLDDILEYVSSLSWIKEKFSIGLSAKLKKREKLNLLWLSLLRYSIYVLQYLFILYFLDVDNSVFEVLSCISTIFLIQSAVPLPASLNFLARIQIAIMVWKFIGLSISISLVATALLWVINILIPALLGLLLILRKWQ